MRNGMAGTKITVAQIISMTSSALVLSSFLIRRVRLEGMAAFVAFWPCGSPVRALPADVRDEQRHQCVLQHRKRDVRCQRGPFGRRYGTQFVTHAPVCKFASQ